MTDFSQPYCTYWDHMIISGHRYHNLFNIMTLRTSILLIPLILTSCSYDNEDERFSLIPGEFPKLVTVPDRPNLPQTDTNLGYFNEIEKKLLTERSDAYVDKTINTDQYVPTLDALRAQTQ